MPPPAATWDAADFHCPVCFSLFDPAPTGDAHPYFICAQHHTVCRRCLASLVLAEHAACPECRAPLSAEPCVNRLTVQFMQRLHLPCGSCADSPPLSIAAAHAHQDECPQAVVSCPMASRDSPGAVCGRRVRCAELWAHCLEQHAAAAPHAVAVERGTLTLTASLTPGGAAVFYYVSMHDEAGAAHWALHAALDEDDGSLALAVRRFGSVGAGARAVLALDADDAGAVVLRVPRVLGPHEALRGSGGAIELPRGVLRCLQPTGALPASLRAELAVEITLAASESRLV